MNKSIITTIIAITALVTFTSADAIIIVVSNPTSGDSGYVNNFNDNDHDPSPFGRRKSGGPGTVSGGQWTFTDDTSFMDVWSTTDLDTTTQVPVGDGTIEDYIIQLDIDNTTAAGGSRVFQADGPVGDLFTLRGAGGALGNYNFHGFAVTAFSAGAGSHQLSFYFDASENNFNVYVDGTEVLSDLAHISGAGDGRFKQFRAGGANRGGTFTIDNIIVSTVFVTIAATNMVNYALLDNNLQCVDLSDLDGDLPLDVVSSTQRLVRDQA